MRLNEILTEEKSKPRARNFVAKHSRNMSGAGRHEAKKGKFAPRQKQKREWKRDVNETIR